MEEVEEVEEVGELEEEVERGSVAAPAVISFPVLCFQEWRGGL